MDLNVVITAPELSAAINNLAAALHAGQALNKASAPADKPATKSRQPKPGVGENPGSTGPESGPDLAAASQIGSPSSEQTAAPTAPAPGAGAPTPSDAAEVTIEQVRAAIVAKGKEKLPEAKKIIEGFGSPNLSQIPKEKFPALLAAVGAL